MVKKTGIALVASVLIIGSSVTAMAAENEKPLWEIIADSFKEYKVREQDKLRGSKEVNTFQNMATGIKDGAKTSKDKSLRK
ncbi:MAG: hypothetical protein ABID09_07410 [Candidatus Omnitrophota bacterium]